MLKNIVVLSDGTGQEGGMGNNTNVYRLFNMLEDRTADQITFYDRGLEPVSERLPATSAEWVFPRTSMSVISLFLIHLHGSG